MLPQIFPEAVTREEWPSRRAGLVELFRNYVYGRRPDLPYQVESRLVSTAPAADGSAFRELYEVTVGTARGSVTMELALVLPNGTETVPVVLLLSNHDREVLPTSPPDMSVMAAVMEKASEEWRQSTMKMLAGMGSGGMSGPELLDISADEDKGYWAVKEIVASGRAAAAFYASQAQIDDRNQFPSGLSALFLDPDEPRADDGWGTLGVWAFAASCMVDVLEKHPRVDKTKISVGGHSRGGKAALWCAVQDERIRGVLVNNSGCTGAAVSRGKQGEIVASINAFFPHWFCPNYAGFSWKETEMPFDQHMLVAAMAPRLCYITSGSEDHWSDPQAEWLGGVEGSAPWKLFGQKGLQGDAPAAGEVVHHSAIGYHKRDGGHDLTAWDYCQFLDFLNKHGG